MLLYTPDILINFTILSSHLTVKNGIYDPTKRFAFTNITADPFAIKWNGTIVTTVKPGDVVELPHHLAVKSTLELTDKIMMQEARDDELKTRSKNKDPYWRSPKGIAVGVPEARRPYEEKILRELKVDEENPQVAIMRAQIKEQLLNDLNGETSKAPPTLPMTKSVIEEFEGANIKGKK